MGIRVNLPEGCSSLRMQDGTRYVGREGGHVTVADEHAPHVRREVGGDAGLVGHGSMRVFAGTQKGRWCPACRKLWNRWNAVCVKCGGETVPESEMPEQPKSAFPSGCAPVAF